MEPLLFGVTLIGIAWLIAWCCVDYSKPSQTWWPFDMRQRKADVPDAIQADPGDRPWRNRQPPAQPWKRSDS